MNIIVLTSVLLQVYQRSWYVKSCLCYIVFVADNEHLKLISTECCVLPHNPFFNLMNGFMYFCGLESYGSRSLGLLGSPMLVWLMGKSQTEVEVT